MKISVLVCAMATAFCPTGARDVRNAPIDDQQRVIVSYGDLDLRSAAGQRHLKNRMRFAANQLCLVDPRAGLSPEVIDSFCVRRTMKQESDQLRAIAGFHQTRFLASVVDPSD